MIKTELKWGETPFHRMTHDELLVHAMRMYSALLTADSVMKLLSHGKTAADLFWFGGTGGVGLERAKQALAAVNDGFDEENIYRSFFRAGNDLLFEDGGQEAVKSKWAVCPKCNSSFASPGGPGEPYKDIAGEKCHLPKCDGILRPLTWEDFKPEDTAIDSETGDKK